MGIFKKGLFSSVSGRIGSMVIYELYGKMIGRSIPKKKKKRKSTPLQLNGQKKIALSIETLKPIVELVNLGFSLAGKKAQKTAYSIATSYAYKCIIGMHPNLRFDFSKLIFAKGGLPVAEDPQVEITAAGLIFRWKTIVALHYLRQNDQVMLLAYFPDEKKARYISYGGKRSTGFQEFILPQDKSMKRVETYIAFISEDRKAISDSVYAGSFVR